MCLRVLQRQGRCRCHHRRRSAAQAQDARARPRALRHRGQRLREARSRTADGRWCPTVRSSRCRATKTRASKLSRPARAIAQGASAAALVGSSAAGTQARRPSRLRVRPSRRRGTPRPLARRLARPMAWCSIRRRSFRSRWREAPRRGSSRCGSRPDRTRSPRSFKPSSTGGGVNRSRRCSALATADAGLIDGPDHGHAALVESWRQRLRAHDYGRLASAEIVLPERIERWEWDELGDAAEASSPRRACGRARSSCARRSR